MMAEARSKTIAIVHRDPELGLTLQLILEQRWTVIGRASNGKGGVELVAHGRPMAVVVDCHLPEDGAGQVIAQSQAAGSRMILLCDDSATMARMAALGHTCLQDPFSVGELIAAVGASLPGAAEGARRCVEPP